MKNFSRKKFFQIIFCIGLFIGLLSIYIYSKGNRAVNIILVFLVLSLYKPIYKNKISLTLLHLIILAEFAYLFLSQIFSLFELPKYFTEILTLPVRYFGIIVISPIFLYLTEVIWVDIFKNSINSHLQEFANKNHSTGIILILLLFMYFLFAMSSLSDI